MDPNALNLNRAVVLLVHKATRGREGKSEMWRHLASMPREIFQEIRSMLLFGYTVITAVLAVLATFAFHWWHDGVWARAATYGLVFGPLALGLAGTVETWIRQSRLPQGFNHAAMKKDYRLPADVDIERNPALLWPSSVAGLLLSVVLGIVLGAADPIGLGNPNG